MAVQIVPLISNPNILDQQEQNLVQSKEMTRFFGLPEDYIQLYIYNNVDSIIRSNLNFQDYSVTENKTISFDPETDIQSEGIRLGTYRMVYNFQRPILTLNDNLDLFIKSISPDRTEVKIATTTDNRLFYTNAITYINTIQNRTYFLEFYLDLGQNTLFPAVSMAVEREPTTENTYVIVKLLDPLPENIAINTPLNVVEKIVDTQEFQAVLTSDTVAQQNQVPSLREANFSLDVDSYRIGSSDYYNYNQIITDTGSYFQTLLGFISSSNPTINVDYTNYENFIHFSSATQRLETFQVQLGKIQTYEALISVLPPTDPNYIIYQGRINEIIQQFDGYENYLYYESGSYSWPKQNSTTPYVNLSVTSSQAILWFNNQLGTAQYYDEFNNDNLVYGLPVYIQESPTFDEVKPFVHAMGQMFDEIWLYIKAMTDLWRAENGLNQGISKDIVGDALQSLGIKLYTDGDQDNIYEYLYGVNSSGSQTFSALPWQTAITASNLTLSGQDEAKGVFKRIYANLPTLLKSKGTDKFVNYLTTLYGTPDTILFPMEFGGVDKSSDTAEYIYNKFTYALQSGFNKNVWVSKNTINPDSNTINTFEIRFKPTSYSQTQPIVTSTNHTTFTTEPYWGVTITGSISGGYDYGVAKLNIKGQTSSVYFTGSTQPLPLFVTGSDGDYNWWNIKVQQNGSDYTLTVQNEVQGEVGHKSTASISSSDLESLDGPNQVFEFGSINKVFTPVFNSSYFGMGNFYGQVQEARGWLVNLSSSTFDTHTIDPESYIGNSTSSAYNDLLFRFPLGNDLQLLTLTTTGSQPNQSYNRQINFSGITQNDYISFVETYYASPAIGGYSTPNTSKIRIANEVLASNQLKPFKSVVYPSVLPTTKDVNLTQAGFSPQDQINNDIIHQLGDTYNLDDLIGNPRESDLNYYPGLEKLQEQYFQKYVGSYNYKDFVQLMETFHKSLFRYLADYIPGRANNATGIVIKPHILERSKVRRYEPTINTASYDGQTWTVTITGSNPGGYCCSRNSPLNEAFFDGDFEGSTIPMDSYFTQNNPFTTAICDCRLYQVTTDALVVYVDCNGETKFESTAGQRTFQVYACKDKIDNLFGSNFYVQDLGQFSKGQAFTEQYEGWNALDNNVENNLVSKVKKKVQPSLKNLFGQCYRTLIANQGGFATTADYKYTDCNNITRTGTLGSFGFINVDALENSVSASGATPSNYITYFIGENVNTQVTSSYEWQDNNVTDAGYVFSREAGTQTTALAVNKTFPADFTFNIYNNTFLGSNSYPNTEQTVDYLLYYDWVTSSIANKVGTSNFHIKYLIDSSGSIYKPEYSSSYFYNTDQGFGKGTPVNITIYDVASGNLQTSVNTTTYMPVKKYETILYSDTGSTGNKMRVGYSSEITFIPENKELIDVWSDIFNRSGDYTFVNVNTSPSFLSVPWNNTITNNDGTFDSSTGTFTALGTGLYQARIQARATLYIPVGSTGKKADIRWTLYKNGVEVFNGPLQSILNDGVPNGKIIDLDTNIDLNEGDSIYLRIKTFLTDAGQPIDLIINGTTATNYFDIGNAATLNTSLDMDAPYATNYFGGWLLTPQFNQFYGSTGSIVYSQNPSVPGRTLDSGFTPPLPLEFQKYDEVRFEGDEGKVYTIMSSSLETIGLSQRRLVYFDKTLSTSINPNYFVVRRLVLDPSFVMINGTGYQGPGFIIPNYPTPQLKNNLSNIIADLSSKGLIP